MWLLAVVRTNSEETIGSLQSEFSRNGKPNSRRSGSNAVAVIVVRMMT